MSVTNINIPTAQSFILVDTRTGPNKVLFLPTASTIQGRYLSIKDYYGNANSSTLTISTTGLDRIDQSGIRYTLASSFGSVMLLSDGARSWNMMGLYEGADTAIGSVVAAPVSTFSPISLTNVIGFFDVNAGISQSGSALTSWTNQISAYSSLNLTSINGSVTVGTYPSNTSLKTILLSSAYIRNNGTAVAMRAFICIINATSTPGLDMLFSLWTVRSDFSFRRVQFSSGSDGNDVNNGADGQVYWNGSSAWNGSSYTITNSPIGSWNILFVRFATDQTTGIGISDPFMSRYYNGYIGDFIFFGTSYTTTEREKTEGYLAWKWGIQANLPSGHPYKSAAPTS